MNVLLKTLSGYQRRYLRQDLLSGLVIAAVSIPISMGYAQIAGLPAAEPRPGPTGIPAPLA